MKWRPCADLATMRLRAAILNEIRSYFAEQALLEVDTPALSSAGIPAPELESMTTCPRVAGGQRLWYLQTSPEFAMKRLLAAGSGSIYQIAKVFRDGECGRFHNPEFQMVEWYRVGFGLHELIDDVETLIRVVLQHRQRLLPTVKFSYQAVFAQFAGIDPWQTDRDQALSKLAHSARSYAGSIEQLDLQGVLDLLLVEVIEPQLPRDRPVFVYDYPPQQAALARVLARADGRQVAERFELYLGGVELANGFAELSDPDEQRLRFEQDNQRRQALGMAPVPIDELFLSALAHLPDCAGVALGLDRLIMIAASKSRLDQVLAFPFHRA